MKTSPNTNRRNFLQTSILFSLVAPSFSVAVEQQQKTSPQTAPQRPPALKAEQVKEFVIAGHGNLNRVKEMLSEVPSLLNATWDWGGGDFETGLGGASHVGNREIAEFFLASGARMDVFAAAMLGKTDIVRAMLTAYPDLKHSRGPHGITLLTHAQKGGAEALVVVEYLQSLGLMK